MITSSYATQYTRQHVAGEKTPARDMKDKRPITTGKKPAGYVNPVPNKTASKRLDIRRRNVPQNKSVPMGHKMPGSLNMRRG